MDNYRRELVIQLWKRSGPFWEAIEGMRVRWNVTTQRALPPKRRYIALLPPTVERVNTPEKEEVYLRWRIELSKIAAGIVPEALHGVRSAYDKSLDDWEPFISACVLFDPPDTDLGKFAELGRPFAVDAASSSGPLVFSSPPISKMYDPDSERAIAAEAWSAAVDPIFELYLKPMGLDMDEVWDQVHARHPEILRNRQQKLHSLPTRDYIQVNEYTTWDDVKEAFKAVSYARPSLPKRGRDKRDRLQCLECAILNDRHGWSYAQLAERYGWLDHTLASKYIKDGRGILKEP